MKHHGIYWETQESHLWHLTEREFQEIVGELLVETLGQYGVSVAYFGLEGIIFESHVLGHEVMVKLAFKRFAEELEATLSKRFGRKYSKVFLYDPYIIGDPEDPDSPLAAHYSSSPVALYSPLDGAISYAVKCARFVEICCSPAP